MKTLTEYAKILDEQSFALSLTELQPGWMIDKHKPVFFISWFDLPTTIGVQELINKTDNEIKKLIKEKIINSLTMAITKIEINQN